MKKSVIAAALAALAVFAWIGVTQAQGWPAKPVTLVNPFAPGGGVDAFGRPLSVYLSRTTGQQFLVENMAGAGGTVGAASAAKRSPDGYTFFLGAVHHTIAESLYARLPYALQRDFVPITVLAYVPNVVVMHPKHANINSIQDLIAHARANPGALNFGSAGNGTTHHLAGELFKTMTGVDMTHVPYKGRASAIPDLLGGRVTRMFDNMPSSLPLVKEGKLRALGVTSLKRSAAAPDIPTIAEQGLPGFEAVSWFALFAPAGTPRPIVDRLQGEVRKILAAPDIAKKLGEIGLDPVGSTPDELAAWQRSEIAKWAKVVKDSGAKPE